MKRSPCAALFLALVSVSTMQADGQSKSAHAKTSEAAPLPFSGTWVLNPQRSRLVRAVSGESRAIIQYDGKTWHYIHTHLAEDEDKPDEWQVTLDVGSTKPHTSIGDDITFHSRIQQVGSALVLTETGVTAHAQRVTNTVRYTLQDNGNTLVETETSVGPLGPTKNVYVLEREGSRPADNALGPKE